MFANTPSEDDDEQVIGAAEPPARWPVQNEAGETIGYVEAGELPGIVSRREFDQMKHDLMQFRNLMLRMQTQIKLIEQRAGHHSEHY